MKLKKAMIVLGILVGSTISFATDFSFTNEIKRNDESNYRNGSNDGKIKDEWTIGRGYYKINDNLKLKFDVDRDIVNYDNDSKNYTGWDTYFGLERNLPSFEMLNRKVSNKVSLDYYWDYIAKSYSKEDEIGLSLTSSLKPTKKTNASLKIWARNVNRNTSSENKTRLIKGLEGRFSWAIVPQLKYSATLKGYWGGYEDGAGTFTGSSSFTGSNIDASMFLIYNKSIYKENNLNIKFRTIAGIEWFNMSRARKRAGKDYNKSYLKPGIVIEYKLADNLKIYGDAEYTVMGNYSTYSSTRNRECNEFEPTIGFSYKF